MKCFSAKPELKSHFLPGNVIRQQLCKRGVRPNSKKHKKHFVAKNKLVASRWDEEICIDFSKQPMIKSPLLGKKGGKKKPAQNNTMREKASTLTKRTHHIRTHPCTRSQYAKHSPCVKRVYVCVSRPLAKVQCSSERPNSAVALGAPPACHSHPGLSCDRTHKAPSHTHFLHSTPPPTLSSEKKKKKSCMH